MSRGKHEKVQQGSPSPARKGKAAAAVPPSFAKQLAQCLCAAVVALSSYFFATNYIFQSVVVDGDSMNPTLSNAQRLMLNRVEYAFREPQWGDIVVIKDPEDGGLSIKRIIAIQGQTVELDGGSVVVDGIPLKENYVPKGVRTYSYRVRDHERVNCGPGEFYVLGDNRANSADSRVYGTVPRQNILGVVVP
jgi:signal peptidase I